MTAPQASPSDFAELTAMRADFEAAGDPRVAPSDYWRQLNRQNLDQLLTHGYERFKRTLAANYFTWLDPHDIEGQLATLAGATPAPLRLYYRLRARAAGPHELISRRRSRLYNLLTLYLWRYAASRPGGQALGGLAEPEEGDPPRLWRNGRLISQDLANSFLEYRAVAEAAGPERWQSVLELGAGYGRTAWVFLKLHPGLRYIVVDLPPALWVAQRYLSSQFADGPVFRYRRFARYEDVRTEFESARLAFLLPSQLALLPEGAVDLALNISSLQEMRPPQIAYYLSEFDRLARGWVFLKQWKESRLPYDDIVIREADYPIPGRWTRVFQRESPVQTRFFEGLYATR